MERYLLRKPKPSPVQTHAVAVEVVDDEQKPVKPTKLAPIFLPREKRKSIESPQPPATSKQSNGHPRKKVKSPNGSAKLVEVLSISDDDEDTIQYDYTRVQRLEDEVANNSWVEKYRPSKTS